ncbi:MAG TPA: hypothetical protein VFI42_08190, partial [Thermomicrobiaceae bacterium]|nr:hypothetical protein [Thermomicrobiaceae bacterium]
LQVLDEEGDRAEALRRQRHRASPLSLDPPFRTDRAADARLVALIGRRWPSLVSGAFGSASPVELEALQLLHARMRRPAVACGAVGWRRRARAQPGGVSARMRVSASV